MIPRACGGVGQKQASERVEPLRVKREERSRVGKQACQLTRAKQGRRILRGEKKYKGTNRKKTRRTQSGCAIVSVPVSRNTKAREKQEKHSLWRWWVSGEKGETGGIGRGAEKKREGEERSPYVHQPSEIAPGLLGINPRRHPPSAIALYGHPGAFVSSATLRKPTAPVSTTRLSLSQLVQKPLNGPCISRFFFLWTCEDHCVGTPVMFRRQRRCSCLFQHPPSIKCGLNVYACCWRQRRIYKFSDMVGCLL